MATHATLPISALALLLAASPVTAQAQSQSKVPPAPDLHQGGASPSSIPNHQATVVTLPGLHLTGTTVTVSGVCSLKSYKVVSDTQIAMTVEGNRPIDSKEDGCFLKVHQGARQAGTYVIVDLSADEDAKQSTNQIARAQAKANAYMTNLGTQWTLHYADGATEIFTAQPADPGQLPEFTSSSGSSVKIMLSNSNQVMILADSCILSGTLAGSQVKDGKASGQCKHSGAWTAQKK